MSYGEPGVITVGVIQTLMLDLIFLKEECFKPLKKSSGALKKNQGYYGTGYISIKKSPAVNSNKRNYCR